MAKRTISRAHKAVAESASGLQSLIDSAEELLESLKDQQGAAVERARERISARLEAARDRLDDLDVSGMASDAVAGTVGFLKRDPWRTVAIGAIAVIAASLLVRGASES